MDAVARELETLGTWEGCAGDPAAWPVTVEGRRSVEWALEVHQDFFGDSWLTAMCRPGNHPLIASGSWPLMTDVAVVRLLERATRLSVLTATARTTLRAGLTHDIRDFAHLDLLLEVAGLATRYEWIVEVEVPLASGRRPDLRLTRHGASFSVEVTRMGLDRQWRATDRWFDTLHFGLLEIESRYGVTTSGDATSSSAITDVDLPRFLADVNAAAAAVRNDQVPRSVQLDELVVTVQPDSPEQRRLEGPPIEGDVWPRIARRLIGKAEQSADGPPTWIRLDELGGLFAVTDWAVSPPDVQLARLMHNVQATLGAYRHVRGVILSHGTTYGRVAPVTIGASARHDQSARVGPALVDRELPGDRARRTLVVPIEAKRILLRTHVEAEPVYWYSTEPSWLDWALRRCQQVPLPGILGRERHASEPGPVP